MRARLMVRKDRTKKIKMIRMRTKAKMSKSKMHSAKLSPKFMRHLGKKALLSRFKLFRKRQLRKPNRRLALLMQ